MVVYVLPWQQLLQTNDPGLTCCFVHHHEPMDLWDISSHPICQHSLITTAPSFGPTYVCLCVCHKNSPFVPPQQSVPTSLILGAVSGDGECWADDSLKNKQGWIGLHLKLIGRSLVMLKLFFKNSHCASTSSHQFLLFCLPPLHRNLSLMFSLYCFQILVNKLSTDSGWNEVTFY